MKKNILINILLIVIGISIILWTYNNYNIYKIDILHITSINEKEIESNHSNEKEYKQIITGIVKNNKNKGKKFTLENTYTESNVYDEKYYVNSDLFVEILNEDNDVHILGVKRDKYISTILVLFLYLIIVISGIKGILAIISLILNSFITVLTIPLFNTGINIKNLFLFIAIIFIITSIFITNGRNKKCFSAIISAILSFILAFMLNFIIIRFYEKSIPYWTIEYIDTVFDYNNFFLIFVLLNSLGAIMDIAITFASSINEIKEKNPTSSFNEVILSAKDISKDIGGTMCNVILFINITSIIPMMIVALRNNMPLFHAFNYYGEIELIIILTSSISIILSIPICMYISTYIIMKGCGK